MMQGGDKLPLLAFDVSRLPLNDAEREKETDGTAGRREEARQAGGGVLGLRAGSGAAGTTNGTATESTRGSYAALTGLIAMSQASSKAWA
jgi:hypothetical protein